MKTILITVLALLASHHSRSQGLGQLEVIVNNVRSDEGVVMVGLFTSEETFTKQAWKGEKPKAKAGTIRVVFSDVPAGDYAISVYHDVNQNGKLDKNLMGIPKEGFGFSNDVMGSFGPPSFEAAKFRMPAARPVAMTMKYF